LVRGRVDGALGEKVLDVGQNSKERVTGSFEQTIRLPKLFTFAAI